MLRFAALFLLTLAAAGQDLLDRGRKAFEAGDYSRAETLFHRHLEQNPGSAEAMSNLAAIHSRRGSFAEAVALYEKALAANPGLVPIHFNLAVARLRSGDYAAAITNLEAYRARYPDDPRGRELLGLCLVETGRLREAVDHLEAVHRAKPDQPGIAFSLAYAHARAGDEARSLALLAGLEQNPAEARLVEGLIEQRRERYPSAEKKFQEALAANPGHPAALAALGRLYLHQNRDQEAVRLLRDALTRAPADAEAAYLLGVLLDRNQQTAEAVRLFHRAAALRARFPGPLYALARIDLRENRPAEAARRLEQALAFAPQTEAIHLLLGRAYQALGDSEKAKARFAEVRRLQQDRLKRQQQAIEDDIIVAGAQ